MLCTNLWCWLTAAVPPSRCSWRERDSERGCSSCVLAVPCSTSSSLIAGEGSASLPANSALSGNCSKGDDYQLAIFWASGWHINPNEPLKTLHHLRNTDVLHEFQVVQPYWTPSNLSKPCQCSVNKGCQSIPGSVGAVPFTFPSEALSLVAFLSLAVRGSSILLTTAHLRVTTCMKVYYSVGQTLTSPVEGTHLSWVSESWLGLSSWLCCELLVLEFSPFDRVLKAFLVNEDSYIGSIGEEGRLCTYLFESSLSKYSSPSSGA